MEEIFYVITKKESVKDLDPDNFWGLIWDDETDIESVNIFLYQDEYDMGQRVTLVV